MCSFFLRNYSGISYVIVHLLLIFTCLKSNSSVSKFLANRSYIAFKQTPLNIKCCFSEVAGKNTRFYYLVKKRFFQLFSMVTCTLLHVVRIYILIVIIFFIFIICRHNTVKLWLFVRLTSKNYIAAHNFASIFSGLKVLFALENYYTKFRTI